jgi:hypothetical protein
MELMPYLWIFFGFENRNEIEILILDGAEFFDIFSKEVNYKNSIDSFLLML